MIQHCSYSDVAWTSEEGQRKRDATREMPGNSTGRDRIHRRYIRKSHHQRALMHPVPKMNLAANLYVLQPPQLTASTLPRQQPRKRRPHRCLDRYERLIIRALRDGGHTQQFIAQHKGCSLDQVRAFPSLQALKTII
ncbi:hypothetical protein J1614_003866 [Plenodomus biglobosus]|nr:hypothetical protein J1614_003866 [Plenodomus biglobosus]